MLSTTSARARPPARTVFHNDCRLLVILKGCKFLWPSCEGGRLIKQCHLSQVFWLSHLSISHQWLGIYPREVIRAWRFCSTNQLVKNWNKIFEGASQWQGGYTGLLIHRSMLPYLLPKSISITIWTCFVGLELALYPSGLELGIFLFQVLIGLFHYAWAWKTVLSFTLTKKINKTKNQIQYYWLLH